MKKGEVKIGKTYEARRKGSNNRIVRVTVLDIDEEGNRGVATYTVQEVGTNTRWRLTGKALRPLNSEWSKEWSKKVEYLDSPQPLSTSSSQETPRGAEAAHNDLVRERLGETARKVDRLRRSRAGVDDEDVTELEYVLCQYCGEDHPPEDEVWCGVARRIVGRAC